MTSPCSPGKQYYGRGAKQLSWNYNYGAFSVAMYGDTETLLSAPELVADTWLNFASAFWFFVTPQPPKPSIQVRMMMMTMIMMLMIIYGL